MSEPAEQLPGKGLFGWLGRQVGHVRRAILHDPGTKTVYKHSQVQQRQHPQDPNVVLRRTTIDEAVQRRPTEGD